MRQSFLLLLGMLGWCSLGLAQASPPLLHNVHNRDAVSLNGNWHYLIDPYETGYRNHRRWEPFDEYENKKASASPYWLNRKKENPSDRIEYDFEHSPSLAVPGDWNHQDDKLLYYEGTVWYERDFGFEPQPNQRYYLYFGAVNYRADVYLNGRKVGFHEGPYDPFNFDVTELLVAGTNEIIVRADNRRSADRVPGLTTDWWNFGGITRDVKLVAVPSTFIQDYHLQLDVKEPTLARGYVQLGGQLAAQQVQLRIPEINYETSVQTDARGYATLEIPAQQLLRWYPERPKRYTIEWLVGEDRLEDQIGFRTIEQNGTDLLLNGKSIFLRGISLHEENPLRRGRAYSREDAVMLMGWARELNCNMIRLAHYPHNENMARLADEIGLLLWEEVPVYWGINYTNPETYAQAESQLRSLISRDKNRASVIIWSVANETPRDDPNRLAFLERMAATVRGLDANRLVSAALDRTEDKEKRLVTVTDPFAQESDMVSVNEYIGWYGSTPARIPQMRWDLSDHNKPLFISEFGAGALYNYHGAKDEIWTEEYQAWMYDETLQMLDAIPSLRGMTPWILVDFRSPRRNLVGIQDGWNRKGVISDRGFKKQAFFILRAYYARKAKEYAYEITD
ncbi:MAG: glycoside hydrolase family 2 TIM barrel-domain containing protein [Bacteroidota bacterium]